MPQNDIISEAFASTGRICAIASEEEDSIRQISCTQTSEVQKAYAAVFDPLDGSRNIDASIPTGTIFGLYEGQNGELFWHNIDFFFS